MKKVKLEEVLLVLMRLFIEEILLLRELQDKSRLRLLIMERLITILILDINISKYLVILINILIQMVLHTLILIMMVTEIIIIMKDRLITYTLNMVIHILILMEQHTLMLMVTNTTITLERMLSTHKYRLHIRLHREIFNLQT